MSAFPFNPRVTANQYRVLISFKNPGSEHYSTIWDFRLFQVLDASYPRMSFTVGYSVCQQRAKNKWV